MLPVLHHNAALRPSVHFFIQLLVNKQAFAHTAAPGRPFKSHIVNAITPESIFIKFLPQLKDAHDISDVCLCSVCISFCVKIWAYFTQLNGIVHACTHLHGNQFSTANIHAIFKVNLTRPPPVFYIQPIPNAVILFQGILECHIDHSMTVLFPIHLCGKSRISINALIHLSQLQQVQRIIEGIDKSAEPHISSGGTNIVPCTHIPVQIVHTHIQILCIQGRDINSPAAHHTHR